MEAALGALLRSTYLKRHVIKKTFHHPRRDLEGVLAIEPGFTLTRIKGRRDLHEGCSGAGTVGDHAIGITSTASGADSNRSR